MLRKTDLELIIFTINRLLMTLEMHPDFHHESELVPILRRLRLRVSSEIERITNKEIDKTEEKQKNISIPDACEGNFDVYYRGESGITQKLCIHNIHPHKDRINLTVDAPLFRRIRKTSG